MGGARTLTTARTAVRRAGLHHAATDRVPGLEGPLPPQFTTLSVRDLAAAVVREKVSSILLRRLREERPELIDGLCRQPTFARARARIETLIQHKGRVLDLIDREARGLGLAVWAVKGLAAQRSYPDPDLRDLGDLDLMVVGVDEAVRLTERLIAAGYDFHSQEWPWIKRSGRTGPIYGQFSLAHRRPDRHPAIDLHFGGYSVRHCGLHPLPDGDSPAGLSYYDTQRNLPLLVGNAGGDHDVTTKDLNDLAFALTEPAVDWSRVLAELEAVRLLGFFRRMIDQFEATPLRPIYRDSALPALLTGVRPEFPAPAAAWAGKRRWAATVLHAFSVGSRHSLARAGVTSVTAARYYWGDRMLKARSGRRHGPARLPRLTSWTCVRLVPAAALASSGGAQTRFFALDGRECRLSAELTAVRTSTGDILRTVLGDFVPGVYTYRRPDSVRG